MKKLRYLSWTHTLILFVVVILLAITSTCSAQFPWHKPVPRSKQAVAKILGPIRQKEPSRDLTIVWVWGIDKLHEKGTHTYAWVMDDYVNSLLPQVPRVTVIPSMYFPKKALTPPIKTFPIIKIGGQSETNVAIYEHSLPNQPLSYIGDLNMADQPEVSLSSRIGAVVLNHGKEWLAFAWLLGSMFVLTFSLVRVYRFHHLLGQESEVAPPELQTVAARIANRLGLKIVPTIYLTSVHLSPLVWWIGGKVRIIIPTTLFDQLETQQSQWILAHELAHVRRRDYLVRWLEWLACICFWWNPVTWWARRNLRANEEICCDALVVSSLKPKTQTYANSLLTAIECLVCPALRPPAIASEINSGGFLERRFKMIVSNNPNRSRSRWLQVWVLLGAVLVLPFGVAFAQDYDAVGRRLRAAVQAGELTGEQARAMLETLRKSSAKDKKEVDYEAIGKKIKAAVKAGKLTEEEAWAKWKAIKKDAATKETDSDRAKAYLMKLRKDLGALVESGKMSEDAAKRKYAAAEKAVKERLAAGRGERDSKRITREDYAQAEAKMRRMVEEGKAKPDDVRRRLIEMRKEMGKQASHAKKGITVEEYRRAEAKMKRMVEDGKAKPEDVERRLIEMRKMMGEQSDRGEKVDWDAIKRRIEGAVKSGKITREEADAKYKAIKERMAGRRER